MEENSKTIWAPFSVCDTYKLPTIETNHALIHGIMSVLFNLLTEY